MNAKDCGITSLCPSLCGLLFALIAGGCSGSSASDAKLEATIKAAQDKSVEKPHYPLTLLLNLMGDGSPIGFTLSAFGNYSRAVTHEDSSMKSMTASEASAKLARAIELTVGRLADLQNRIPPPQHPSGSVWNASRHPAMGTFDIQLSYGDSKTVFNVPAAVVSGQGAEKAKAEASIREQTDKLIDQIKRSEETSGHSGGAPIAPAGFTVSAKELSGTRISPFILGSKLMLLPVDTANGVRELKSAILFLTQQVKGQGKSTATITVYSPLPDLSLTIPTSDGPVQTSAIDRGVSGIAAQLDSLNAAAQTRQTKQ